MMLLIALALAATPASAADSGQCDSKPFTLKKPLAPAPQAAPVAPKPTLKPAAAAKPAKPHNGKYVIGCKQPKG
jgi:hypothetical protein